MAEPCDSRSVALLEAEVVKLNSALATALQELSNAQAENRRLRKLLLPTPSSLSRKRTREEGANTTQAKRLKPVRFSFADTTPVPQATPSLCSASKTSTSTSTAVAHDPGKVSASKVTLQRKAESRRKVMSQLVRDFSEHCRPVYSAHLEKEREGRQHFKSVDLTGKHKFRLLR